jgi:two-component sensor histidine kinase
LKQDQSKRDSILLEVADNGVGLPPGLEQGKSNSLGWVLVQSLAKQLGGQVQVLREGGTTVQISFKGEHKLEAAA